jgi:hypothetical protein
LGTPGVDQPRLPIEHREEVSLGKSKRQGDHARMLYSKPGIRSMDFRAGSDSGTFPCFREWPLGDRQVVDRRMGSGDENDRPRGMPVLNFRNP